MLNITAITAFSDNYIWCIYDPDTKQAIVVDPGSYQAVEDFLVAEGLKLEAILITHHHPDHVGGVTELKAKYAAKAYGFKQAKFTFLDYHFTEGDEFTLLGCLFRTLEVPGHTLDHIAFYSPAYLNLSKTSTLSTTTHQTDSSRVSSSNKKTLNRHKKPWLFCGDTLFSGGCGRLFEGTAKQMHQSLTAISKLPVETEIYCAHEYTLSNLEFATSLMPNNEDLRDYQRHCEQLRNRNTPTIPSTIDTELKINPFLRISDNEILENLNKNSRPIGPEYVFAAIRKAKDAF